MSGEQPSKRMTFTTVAGSPTSIEAQFNPTSLQYTITNTAQRGSGQQRQQRIDDSSAKLTFDLIFDSTHTGSNVRLQTEAIAKLMAPVGQEKVPPQVKVEWGEFSFTGIVDSYKETIDYFSTEGVPLRAAVSLGMSNVSDKKNKAPSSVFEFATPGAGTEVDGEDFAVDVPTGDRSTTDMATAGGDPSRGRDLARANGVEDPRNPGGSTDTMTIDDAGPELGDPLAFATGASVGASAGFGASAGAGFGASAGAGFSGGASVGAGFSAGASAGFSGGASAGFSAGAGADAGFSAGAGANARLSAGAGISAGSSTFRAGSSASAGVSATQGAFALLRAPAVTPRRSFDPARLIVRQQTSVISTRGATFAVGGRIEGSGSAGFSADVGASTSARIAFDEED